MRSRVKCPKCGAPELPSFEDSTAEASVCQICGEVVERVFADEEKQQ